MSEAPAANQALPAPVEVPTDSRQREKVVAPQGEDKNQDKGKGKASDAAISQSKQVADPQVLKTKT